MCLKLFKRYSKCTGMIFPFPNCCSLIFHLHILTLCLCVFSKKLEGFHWWEKKKHVENQTYILSNPQTILRKPLGVKI